LGVVTKTYTFLNASTNWTFDDTLIQSVSDAAELKPNGLVYPITNPTILTIEGEPADSLTVFSSVTSIVGLDEIRYILQKDNVDYYFDGANWVISNGTFTESNTELEVSTNIASFTITALDFKLKVFLHSDNGTTTPTWTSTTITYNFVPTPPDLNEVIIWGWLRDILDEKVETVTVQPRNDLFGTLTYIQNDIVNVTVNTNGSFEVALKYEDVVPTELIWTFGTKTIVTSFIADPTVKFSELTRI
jgi:hypothetical protein